VKIRCAPLRDRDATALQMMRNVVHELRLREKNTTADTELENAFIDASHALQLAIQLIQKRTEAQVITRTEPEDKNGKA
jgi:hypothetical protein